MNAKTAVIIGAGPAGLTAALELLEKTDIMPVIYEQSGDIGGISKTIPFKGNRIDLGGHRFFSKSDRVMEWWKRVLPVQGAPARDELLLNACRVGGEESIPLPPNGPDPERVDAVMLVRKRLSRVLFLRRFFNYPISLSPATVRNLGMARMVKIGVSYAWIKLFPVRQEKTLEDFFINRFGRELYNTFFKDYTEKVWGVPCHQISAEWGAQRIKSLSIGKALAHALKRFTSRDRSLAQKETETSLIEQFMYPKLGPGQMWEEVAAKIRARGGSIFLHHQVVEFTRRGDSVSQVSVVNTSTGERKTATGDYFFSTMPVKDLVRSFNGTVPREVRAIADGLMYRDFITVGLLLRKMKIRNETGIPTPNDVVPDNWIYVQERDVKVGRLQIFNNWSPYMVADPAKVWIGMEYFCNEGDELWSLGEEELKGLATEELAKIGVIEKSDVLDGVVIRMPKTYPAYFGTYDRFGVIREFTDRLSNLFLIGRNGMHRYNNQDHSMLTAMVAVENVLNHVHTKDNIWAVNTEEEYHEEKQ